MADTSRILFVLTDLILPLIVGYFLHRKNVISDRFANLLIRFNVICVYTTLTCLSFWVLPLNWDLAILFPFGMLYMLVPWAICSLTTAKRYKNLLNRGAYVISAMVSNIGTLGGVCTYIIYGERGFAYSQMLGTCQTILLVLICFSLAQYYHDKHFAPLRKEIEHISKWKKFFTWNQLSIVGMSLGVILNASGVHRPDFLSELFKYLVHFGAWTAMLPVGYLINFGHVKYYYHRVWDLSILRFFIMPLFIWFTSRLFFDDPVILNTLFVCSMAPTAINSVLTARLYSLNVDLAVTSFIETTAIFLFIIFPAFFFLMR